MYTLVMYNKTYSSWSVRPWFAMKMAGIAFRDEVYRLREEDDRARVRRLSPSGLLPLLIDGDIRVWDSLAIVEYLAERHPEAGLWPQERAARARARSISAEMHSGFAALRRQCPMNMRRAPRPLSVSAETRADLRRIEEIWSRTRAEFGAGGPFLFGRFTAADAMFMPVVSRIHAYALPVGDEAFAYAGAVMALPAWAELLAEGAGEPSIAEYDDVA